MSADWNRLAQRLEELVARLERLVPLAESHEPDWKAQAFRWRKHGTKGGALQAVRHPHSIRFSDLKDVEEQKRRLREKTAQFVAGRAPANMVPPSPRGSGNKSLA